MCSKCGSSYAHAGFCGRDGAQLCSNSEDPLLGSVVGVYQIAELIGVGGWGRVYKAVHPEIGSRVAIKVLSRDCAEKPELLKRFFNEARAVNVIRHESIVNIIDLAQLPDERPYIVMEYLDGLSLAKHIANQGQLGISETCRYCAEVLEALSAAHAQHIIHRDLKPDNLFITPEGRAKVLDFGIAKLRGDDEEASHTRVGSLLGTPHFMSPEQALARPVDPRSDLYSMGVILFQCLTGSLPFEANSLLELARAHVERPPLAPQSLRPEIPEDLNALVLRALAKNPEHRWQNAASLAEALRRISAQNPGSRTKSYASEQGPVLSERPSSTPLETLDYVMNGQEPPAPVAASKSRKGLVLGAGLLVVGAASALALFTIGNRGENAVARAEAEQADSTDPVSTSPKHASQATPPTAASKTAAAKVPAASVDAPPETQPGETLAAEPQAEPGEVIAVPEPSATCLNPEEHCLPAKLIFASLEPWTHDKMRVALAKQITKADRAGEASFRTLAGDKELVTGSFYKSHRARRNEILLGSMMIFFQGNDVNGILRAPATRAQANSRYWYLGRIVSTAGIPSGGYVLMSGGQKVDVAALRVVEGDKSQTTQVTGPVDAHFLRDAHWIRTKEPYNDENLQRAWVAVALQKPGPATQGEGHFLSTSSGKEYWTAHASHTRVARKKDIKLGVRVFFLRSSVDDVYHEPKSRTQALSADWLTGLITDPSKAFKGQVQVGEDRMVSVDALRVIRD